MPLSCTAPNRHPAASSVVRERDQFVNVADIAPTIYDLVGVTPPAVHRASSSSRSPATRSPRSSPTRPRRPTNTLQYFEMAGSRALVAGEWKAVCKHQAGADYDTEPWELYRLSDDRSECHDLAAEEPAKLDGAGRAVVGRGRSARCAPARRPHDRAVRRPVPRPFPPSRGPALRVPAADVAAARARRPRRSAAASSTSRPG